MKEVGPLMKEIIRIKKVDQKELAVAIGVSEQQIGHLLKVGAEKWKLIYFVKACKFLHVNPNSFFDTWKDSVNSITGNVENSSFTGNSNVSLFNSIDSSLMVNELRERLADKDRIIDSLTEMVNLQRRFINNKID